MRLLYLAVQYDGTEFYGWQRQREGVTVQALLEEKLSRLLGEKTTVIVAGRTDTGVHARRQYCHINTPSSFPVADLCRALNGNLPTSVRIISAGDAPPGFHARHRADLRTYRYFMFLSPQPSPFMVRYVWHRPMQLDLKAMQQAASSWLGNHDFAAFTVINPEVKSTRRTIVASHLCQQGRLLYYEIVSPAFLRHQVRRMVGLLDAVGRGKWPPTVANDVLSEKNRTAAEYTAPPQGLFLWQVTYPDFTPPAVPDGLEIFDDFTGNTD